MHNAAHVALYPRGSPRSRRSPLATALAAAASADKLLFSGTHAIKFAHNGVIKEVAARPGTGVAIANGAGGGTRCNTLELTRPFAKINATVHRHDARRDGIDEIRFEDVRIDPSLAGPDGLPGESSRRSSPRRRAAA